MNFVGLEIIMICKLIDKILLDKTIWKFILVGIINTIFGFTLSLVLFNVFEFSREIATVSDYVFGSILSYFLNKYFTFQNKERNLMIVLKFIINIVVCYVAAYGIAKYAVMFVFSGQTKKVQGNIIIFVGKCLFVGFNYFGQRFFAFRKSDVD